MGINKANDTTVTDVILVKKWEKCWNQLEELNRLSRTVLYTILTTTQRLRTLDVFKSLDTLIELNENFYENFDEFMNNLHKVEPVEIKLPWEGKRFEIAWDNWKKYLIEQHGIVISSRTQQKQLENLYKITEGDENKAYQSIDYSIANFYRSLFKLDEKTDKKEIVDAKKRKENDY